MNLVSLLELSSCAELLDESSHTKKLILSYVFSNDCLLDVECHIVHSVTEVDREAERLKLEPHN